MREVGIIAVAVPLTVFCELEGSTAITCIYNNTVYNLGNKVVSMSGVTESDVIEHYTGALVPSVKVSVYGTNRLSGSSNLLGTCVYERTVDIVECVEVTGLGIHSEHNLDVYPLSPVLSIYCKSCEKSLAVIACNVAVAVNVDLTLEGCLISVEYGSE